jgi:biofilm protein TabA
MSIQINSYMFCDTLINFSPEILQLHPQFKSALQWITDGKQNPRPLGKSEIGEGMFAIVQEYNPKPLDGAEFENHHQFIDIQAIEKGVEAIYWTKMTDSVNFSRTAKYSVENDIEFYGTSDVETESSRIILTPGMFMILWPGDWHMPGISPQPASDTQISLNRIRKIVIKVPINF